MTASRKPLAPLPANGGGLPPSRAGASMPSLPPPANGGPAGGAVAPKSFAIKTGVAPTAQKIVIYGTGGIGKTTLASLAPNPIVFDTDGGAHFLNVPRIDSLESFPDVRSALAMDEVKQFGTIVIDSVTKVEELIGRQVIATVPLEKGGRAKNLEDYGYGKGYNHLFETFLVFMQDLEAVVRRGQNVILIAHDCTGLVPNPGGDDWIRYEPRVWQSKNGNNSLRQKLKEWADHLFFIGYDLAVKDGRATGSGTRTIYPQEQPYCLAKSRTLRDPIQFIEGDTSLWDFIFNTTQNNGGNVAETQ